MQSLGINLLESSRLFDFMQTSQDLKIKTVWLKVKKTSLKLYLFNRIPC